MKLSELKGKSVVSVVEAVKLGVVGDAFVDHALGAISALRIDASGRSDQYLVSMDQVRAIGPDVVTVSGQHALMSPSQMGDDGSRVALTSLVGCRVVAEDGRVLGTVAEVDFDPGSGRLDSLEYGGDGLQALLGTRHHLDPRNVIGVGPRVLTVRDVASRPHEPHEKVA